MNSKHLGLAYVRFIEVRHVAKRHKVYFFYYNTNNFQGMQSAIHAKVQ